MMTDSAMALNTPATTPVSGAGKLVHTADNALGRSIELVAVMLIILEVVILFSGVAARYVLHVPLVWTDELASILFLWLSMLGAVIALRRGQHMRMTAFVDRVSPDRRLLLEGFASSASLAFLALFLYPAFEYAYEESYIVTPALEISNAWHAAALPVGIALMILTSVFRMAMTADRKQLWISLGVTLALLGVFWLAHPVLMGLGKFNLVIFFVFVVAACVFSGVPIAFSFALATFGYLTLTTQTPIVVMVGRLNEGMSHLILLAVPLFIFLGALIEMTGMARAMIQFLASCLGHVRGGSLMY